MILLSFFLLSFSLYSQIYNETNIKTEIEESIFNFYSYKFAQLTNRSINIYYIAVEEALSLDSVNTLLKDKLD